MLLVNNDRRSTPNEIDKMIRNNCTSRGFLQAIRKGATINDFLSIGNYDNEIIVWNGLKSYGFGDTGFDYLDKTLPYSPLMGTI